MATMLAFLATDAAVGAGAACAAPCARGGGRELQPLTRRRRDLDERHACCCSRTAPRATPPLRSADEPAAPRRFAAALARGVRRARARAGARRRGRDEARDGDVCAARARPREAERAARRIANSLLVKTALFGGDPNWGRILQTVGRRPRRRSTSRAPRCARRASRCSARAPPPAPPRARRAGAAHRGRRRSTSTSTSAPAAPRPRSGPATSPTTTSASTPSTRPEDAVTATSGGASGCVRRRGVVC